MALARFAILGRSHLRIFSGFQLFLLRMSPLYRLDAYFDWFCFNFDYCFIRARGCMLVKVTRKRNGRVTRWSDFNIKLMGKGVWN